MLYRICMLIQSINKTMLISLRSLSEVMFHRPQHGYVGGGKASPPQDSRCNVKGHVDGGEGAVNTVGFIASSISCSGDSLRSKPNGKTTVKVRAAGFPTSTSGGLERCTSWCQSFMHVKLHGLV
jgi:hypothetical protein